MEMESKVFLGSEVLVHPENIDNRDVAVTSCTSDHVEALHLVAKKTTRQWAAWTHQEEESFFTALRHVGKNFERITHCVQSKNKDQVRHYYYRLVRRMNKLLGPGLCLDAKNSKDTNAAMLRWWSLLEKYSCKASKLHLKPRRFKVFIEALENQLLKDRKKNVRKRPSQGESGSATGPSTITNQNRAPGHDAQTIKLVLLDNQNMQKLGAGRGSLKWNINMGVVHSNNKRDSAVMKPARQRRKKSVASSAAYRRWEKAAIAGVSLVADAAEHLEQTATDKEVKCDQGITEQKDPEPPVENCHPPLPASLQNNNIQSNIHANLKLKLQLFPIDDGTRRALEMDKHNPHLELTLSTRKKISSVLEHLNRKWGDSSVASGVLMLFPYGVNKESLVGYHRWTQDSIDNAADVYASIGSPAVFRLRYGWFSNTESVTLRAPLSSNCVPGGNNVDKESGQEKIMGSVSTSGSLTSSQSQKGVDLCNDQATLVNKTHYPAPCSTDVPNEIRGHFSREPTSDFVESFDPAANMSQHGKGIGKMTNVKQLDDADDLRLNNGIALSAREWADGLTNISIGDLLSEVPDDVNPNCTEPSDPQSDQQIPFSCDSFDAAIAAHISRHYNKICPPTLTSLTSSIWDAEETCDAFSFQKKSALHQQVPTSTGVATPGACKQMARTGSRLSGAFVEELPHVDQALHYHCEELPMDECPSDSPVVENSDKNLTGLTDIYWPDSLGPLDLDIPSCKYHSEDLILSDSLSGLNHLIASSLDAFQNCSFFGLDKRDQTSTGEA